MIFGFGKGKIEIFLEKFNFSPGETIKGKVLLQLKEPIFAKQLKIGLFGLKITTRRVTLRGTPTTETKKEFIYKFEMPLDGEKEYLKGEYPFEIKIPSDIFTTPPQISEGALGAVIKTMQMLSSLSGITSRVEWYLEVSLCIPKGFDIKKKVNINIG
jgi:hypothetical protein